MQRKHIQHLSLRICLADNAETLQFKEPFKLQHCAFHFQVSVQLTSFTLNLFINVTLPTTCFHSLWCNTLTHAYWMFKPLPLKISFTPSLQCFKGWPLPLLPSTHDLCTFLVILCCSILSKGLNHFNNPSSIIWIIPLLTSTPSSNCHVQNSLHNIHTPHTLFSNEIYLLPLHV